MLWWLEDLTVTEINGFWKLIPLILLPMKRQKGYPLYDWLRFFNLSSEGLLYLLNNL